MAGWCPVRTLVLKPRMSEKTYAVSEAHNTYVFEVPAGSNKQLVAESVKAQYKVTVTKVRIAKTASRSRKTIRRRGRNTYRGHSPGIRKAYVTLKESDKLPIFASVKEEEQKEAKAAEKASKKENK